MNPFFFLNMLLTLETNLQTEILEITWNGLQYVSDYVSEMIACSKFPTDKYVLYVQWLRFTECNFLDEAVAC
mgnify:CR=1 FL=1